MTTIYGMQKLRKLLFQTDADAQQGRCWVCLAVVGQRRLHSGHVIDRSVGGPDILLNLKPMCRGCNRWKPKHGTFEEVEEWAERRRYSLYLQLRDEMHLMVRYDMRREWQESMAGPPHFGALVCGDCSEAAIAARPDLLGVVQFRRFRHYQNEVDP